MKKYSLKNIKQALALLLALTVFSSLLPMPPMAHAQDTGVITGLFGVQDAMRVTSIQVYNPSTEIVPTILTPYQSYDIAVTVYHPESLEQLEEIQFKLWYDDSGNGSKTSEVQYFDPDSSHITTPELGGNFDSTKRIQFTWDKGVNSVSKQYAYGTTWECDLPPIATPANYDINEFTFKFRIRIGKVALEANDGNVWQIGAKAYDQGGDRAYGYFTDPAFNAGLPMAWYGEIVVPEGTIADWGNIHPGIDFDHANARAEVNNPITYFVNGNHNKLIKSSTTWLNSTEDKSVTLSQDAIEPNTFALSAIFGNPGQWNRIGFGPAGDFVTVVGPPFAGVTGEMGDELHTYNNLYIKLNSSIVKDIYTGSITYGISNT